MKKIAIITIVDSNLGNRLQNYAVHRYFTRLGYDAVTLNINNKQGGYKYYINGICHVSFYLGDQIFGIAQKIKKEGLISIVRERRFGRFTRQMIPTRVVPFWNMRVQEKYDREFDYFAVGSDQVWNVLYGYGTKVELLEFTEDSKKICVCPSIGLDELPKHSQSDFAQGIMKFRKLSVREETGARIIKELTGRQAEVLVDPTFMLDENEWKQCAKKPQKIDFSRRYILSYFLGKKSGETTETVRKLSKERDLKVFELLDPTCKELYEIDPFEFLYLIQHASFVCTDSFHAVVFSIIFHIPFYSFKRVSRCGSMGGRVENLLNQLQLPVAEYDNLGCKVSDWDHCKVKEMIALEKSRFDSFIQSSMNSNLQES